MRDLPPMRGRGATGNAASARFDAPQRDADGDWLDARAGVDGAEPPLRTTVTLEAARTAITTNASPDIPFDRSINAYRGCEHGCVYCFARPTHAWLGLSPGLDFESRLYAKPGVPDLLRAELAKPGYRPAPIALGTNTDPYQPIEAGHRITRRILDVLWEHRHPVTITTKSGRVLDDLDLIARMAADGLASVAVSLTTLDPATARTLEPRASAPHRRLAAIRALSESGVPTYVSMSPLIPAINDHEIEAVIAAAAGAGATHAFSLLVRLPHEVAPLFRTWLDAHHPDRAAKVMALIREARGGKDNESAFFDRFRPKGAYAAMLLARFRAACVRHGLNRDRPTLRTDLFTPPHGRQLALL
jgi:DNA repair photolyase